MISKNKSTNKTKKINKTLGIKIWTNWTKLKLIKNGQNGQLDKQKIEFGQIGQNKKFRTSINRSCIKGLDTLDKMDKLSEKVILNFIIFF